MDPSPSRKEPDTPAVKIRQLSLDAIAEANSPLQPHSLKQQYEQGIEFYKKHQYTEAIESLNAVIDLSPSYANAYYNKGLALKALGRYEDAMMEFHQAIELKPNNLLYLCSQGRKCNILLTT